MYPVNHVYLNGGNDPLLGNSSSVSNSIEAQLNYLQQQRDQLLAIKDGEKHINTERKESSKLIWDSIDNELASLTDSQREKLLQSEEYITNNGELQTLIQEEIIKIVKPKIESYENGKELLEKQHKLVKTLKVKVVEESDREMELFTKFREFSRSNPGITYEEFIKSL